MPTRALIDKRPWLLASIVAAVGYYFLPSAFPKIFEGLWLISLKGAGVGFLAIYAMQRTKGLDGAILVLVLALSAAADMVLELSFEGGGALFAASHLVAVILYLRNRRQSTSVSQKLLAATLLIGTPVIAFLLSGQPEIALYALTLGCMAAAAWMSKFPRYRVGTGAVLFVASDWLIFSRMGAFDLAPLPDALIWPLYYAGQLMIATGIVQTLRGERPAK
jgi:uncharacterized membrane protein YhhN